MTEYHKLRHCVYRLDYHIVLVVKYRKQCITDEIGTFLVDRSRIVAEAFGGDLIEGKADLDHLHLVISLPPAVCISDFVASLKNTTSRMVRKQYAEYLKQYLWGNSFWTDSYFISSTGGAALDIIMKYVESQGNPKRAYRKKQSISTGT